MTRDEALAREAQGLPIESIRELVLALLELQMRRLPRTDTRDPGPVWYVMNRLIRYAMWQANEDEPSPPLGMQGED